jgi:NitT/TauT family transport system substrate-binding protein/putative hydroxymethylpyrimidine transport system substrate-binding protein
MALACLAAAGCGGGSGDAPEPGTIALDFQPNAVHAGIYATDLKIRVPAASTDSLKLLAAGRADMSVVDIHDLALAREAGSDIVGVGALVQRPLAAVIARSDRIKRPRDLEGKRVGVTGLPSDNAVLHAVMENDGGNYNRVKKVTIGFSAVPSLIAGKVDAVVAFWNAEGVALKHRGFDTREFRVDDYGAPRYPELVLAVKGSTLKKKRELIDTMLEAIEKGTFKALDDRDATVKKLVDASGADEPLVRAQLAAVSRALLPPVSLDRRVLDGWAAFEKQFGIVKEEPDVDQAFPLR